MNTENTATPEPSVSVYMSEIGRIGGRNTWAHLSEEAKAEKIQKMVQARLSKPIVRKKAVKAT